jgi:cytidylate kinase
MSDIPVITIDGPGGSGKGTLARLLAHELEFNILDSGAIYRLLAIASQRRSVDSSNETKLANLAAEMRITFSMDKHLNVSAYLEDDNVSDLIRSEMIGGLASIVSAFPAVRDALLQKQRDFRQLPGLVTDGRDMGTVVFPDAMLKIFLIASAEIRAERRYKQLKSKGINANLAQLLTEIQQRDERDTNRVVSPLKPANDSITIDSSELAIEDVVQQVLVIARERLGG